MIKQSAASPHLLTHRGQALVFDTIEDYHGAPTTRTWRSTESILVVRGAGPQGLPGHAGGRQLGAADQAAASAASTDMVRISDARMSGTAYGTVILHVAPEAAAGGPLALVRTGDWIDAGRAGPLADTWLCREDDWLGVGRPGSRPRRAYSRGYARLYVEHVLQADKGADLDFLVGASGAQVPRDNH